jgi:type I restriction enzyme S subunit
MSQNWKTYKLSQIATLRKQNIAPKDFEDQLYIGLEHIGQGNFLLEGIGKATDATSNKSVFLSGDILYGKIRPYFKKVYRPQFDGICSTDILIIKSKNKDLILQEYLHQIIKTQEFTDKATETSSGTKMPRADWSSLLNYEISVPPLPEQRSIASILSALDDKIELNLQMNKTLEEMAMALYKHWFVDFGPFQNGEFVDSELGMIPKGWEVNRLDDILEIRRGGSPRPIQDFLSDEGLPWMKISDATASNSPFLYSTKEYIKIEGLRKTVLIKPGSIILSNSATPGLPRLIEFETCIHDGWLHFPQIKRFNRYILYLLFLDIKEHLIQQGNGSVFTNLKTEILKSQLINLPPLEVETNFTNQITPWFEQIRNNTKENQTLTTLRDTLLPKLISGEVRVKEAESILEEVL